MAFFVGLMDNLGPVQHHADVIFDKVITNEGNIYHEGTGRVTATVKGIYHFTVVISAQGKEKVVILTRVFLYLDEYYCVLLFQQTSTKFS